MPAVMPAVLSTPCGHSPQYDPSNSSKPQLTPREQLNMVLEVLNTINNHDEKEDFQERFKDTYNIDIDKEKELILKVLSDLAAEL